MSDIYNYISDHLPYIKSELLKIVRAESPSNNKGLLLECENTIKSIFENHFGDQFELETYQMDKRGNHFKYELKEGKGTRILFLSHYDTVWAPGTLPIVEKNNKIYGPGIFDMKAGLLSSIWIIKVLNETIGTLPFSPVFLFTGDEEIGSGTSKDIIEDVAKTCDAVFVMEPPTSRNNALKIERKGVGKFRIKTVGVSAHAGNHHKEGASAILEMSKIVQKLESLTDYKKGTTLNVGKIRGGTATNVVPESAEITVDVRVRTIEEARKIEKYIHSLKVTDPEIDIYVKGGLNRPPMEKTAGNMRLFKLAVEAGKNLGLKVQAMPVGGGSDGNFTSALGIPTLDGLGIPGGGPHARTEHIKIDLFPEKCALVAEICLLLSKEENRLLLKNA